MEISTHPARLEYPQKRIGARGEGKWQRVSRDEALDALMKLDLLIVSELFMTPTAAMADFVLPAATTGEHDTTGYWGEPLQVATPSGKVEIFSEQMRDLGSSPMPLWKELCRLHGGDLSDQFPLLPTTRLEDAYKLTGFKQLECGKKRKAEPLASAACFMRWITFSVSIIQCIDSTGDQVCAEALTCRTQS